MYIYMCIYIYICDISSLRVNGPSEPGRLRDVCVCQWVNSIPVLLRCYVIPVFVPIRRHLPIVTNAIYFLVRL